MRWWNSAKGRTSSFCGKVRIHDLSAEQIPPCAFFHAQPAFELHLQKEASMLLTSRHARAWCSTTNPSNITALVTSSHHDVWLFSFQCWITFNTANSKPRSAIRRRPCRKKQRTSRRIDSGLLSRLAYELPSLWLHALPTTKHRSLTSWSTSSWKDFNAFKRRLPKTAQHSSSPNLMQTKGVRSSGKTFSESKSSTQLLHVLPSMLSMFKDRAHGIVGVPDVPHQDIVLMPAVVFPGLRIFGGIPFCMVFVL